MGLSGFSAEELFQRGEELAYDDITIIDTTFSEITKKDVCLGTDLGKGIKLAVPVVAAPMDSVVSPAMAIAIARLGGIAAVHYNHKDAEGNPSIDKQIEEIRRVKRAQNGFIENPITVSPEMTIAEAVAKGLENKIGDDSVNTFPVTEDGQSNGRLVGLLRKDDYFRGSRTDFKVKDRMLGLEKMVIKKTGIRLEEAQEVLWGEHIKSLPIVDEGGNLAYLVTRGDIEKREQFPNATVDDKGRLRVLFAVDTWPKSYERIARGFEVGADGVIVDTSQGFTRFAFEMLKYISEKFPDKLLIGGNISTAGAAMALAELGFVDAYRCGQGSGSICTTAEAIGISRAGATAVYECARAVRKAGSEMKTIADGGLRSAGDMFKALILGAHATMLGNMLAGHKECPGDIVTDENGKPMKEYWGMGSKKAQVGGNVRLRDYGRHEEGIVKRVPYKGDLYASFNPVIDALLHSFEVVSCRSIAELHEGTLKENYRFGRRSIASFIESKPHD